MNPDRDDDKLISAYAAGDPSAAAVLTTRHIGRILSLSQRMLGDAQEAEDVAQEVMLQLWRTAPRWEAGRAQVSTWLYRVASNLCTDRLRKRKPSDPIEIAGDPASHAPSAADRLLDQQRQAALQCALSQLPDQQRAVVVLRYIEGLSTAQTAEAMHLSIDATQSLAARGRGSLAKLLADQQASLGYRDEQG